MEQFSIKNALELLKQHKKWFLILGIIMVVLGCLALSNQILASGFVTILLGCIFVLTGVIQAVHSLKVKGFGRSLFLAILAVIYVIAGITCFTSTETATQMFTLIIGIVFLFSGAVQIINGISNRHFPRWGWVVFSGLISLVLGFMIISTWPFSGLWVLGMFLGIDLLFQGWSLICISLALKNS